MQPVIDLVSSVNCGDYQTTLEFTDEIENIVVEFRMNAAEEEYFCKLMWKKWNNYRYL